MSTKHRKPLFAKEPESARESQLEDNCYEIAEDLVRREYSDEEMENFKTEFSKI